MSDQVPNPQGDSGSPAPAGSPSPQGSGAAEDVEAYKNRLSGAMSALDKERTAHAQTKAQLQTLEANLRGELTKLQTDLASLASERAKMEESVKKLAEEKARASAELARYNAVAEKPGLMHYRTLLPLTEDEEQLKAAVAQLEAARALDLQRLKEQAGNAPPPPAAPPAAMTKEALNELRLKYAGTPEFEKYQKMWEALVTNKQPGG